MGEYTVECYIDDENAEKDIASYFQNSSQKREWANRKEAQALSDFYSTDIKITPTI